jgi:hypothetical protein
MIYSCPQPSVTRHGIKGLRQILTGFFDFRLPAQTMRNIKI